jgi:hypothetical protein
MEFATDGDGVHSRLRSPKCRSEPRPGALGKGCQVVLDSAHGRLVGASRLVWSWEVRLDPGTESRVQLLGVPKAGLGAAGGLGASDLLDEVDNVVGNFAVGVEPGLACVLGGLGLVECEPGCAKVGLVVAGDAETRFALAECAIESLEELVGCDDGRFGLEPQVRVRASEPSCPIRVFEALFGSGELAKCSLPFDGQAGETGLCICDCSGDFRMVGGLAAEPVDLGLSVGTGDGIDVAACFLEGGLERPDGIDGTGGAAVGLCGGALVGRPRERGGENVVGAWDPTGSARPSTAWPLAPVSRSSACMTSATATPACC